MVRFIVRLMSGSTMVTPSPVASGYLEAISWLITVVQKLDLPAVKEVTSEEIAEIKKSSWMN
jgi:hypothetical protein